MKWYRSAYFAIYNAILFLIFGAVLFYFHGTVHSPIIAKHYMLLDGGLKEALFSLERSLEVYRVCGVISLAFSVWGMFCKPRWMAFGTVVTGVLSCILIVVSA